VFCQSLTFSASANPIKYQGAKPVFIDSDHTWNMCPKALEKALEKYTNDGKKPKLKVASLKQRQIRKHLTNTKSIIKLIHDQTLSFMLKVSRV